MATIALFPLQAYAEEATPAVTTIVTAGGDDTSYRIPLTTSVIFNGISYDRIYATTNSVITFGNPDNTYWTYPTTPSISVESRDWWVLPTQMPDTHFILSVSDGGFQVDGAYRPFGSYLGGVTNIVITAQIQTDGTVAYSYLTTGPLWGDERTGARLANGAIVSLEEAGIVQVETAPQLEATPVAPEPTPAPTPDVPVVQPSTPEIPLPIIVRPVPAPVEPIVEQPSPEPVPVEPVPVEPIPVQPQPSEQPSVPQPEPVIPDTPSTSLSSDEVTTLANGVVLPVTVAQALELFNSPTELLGAIFADPAQVLTALSNIGADMTPEQREQSQKAVVAAVIVGGIVSQSRRIN